MQRIQLETYDYFNQWKKLLAMLTNEQVKTKSWHMINEKCVELKYTDDLNYDAEPKFGSEITAAFTTDAGISSMSMVLLLDPSQLIYCDTDRVICRYDASNSN